MLEERAAIRRSLRLFGFVLLSVRLEDNLALLATTEQMHATR